MAWMLRTYKRKGSGKKWTEEDMNRAISSLLNGHVSMRGAAGIFRVPYSTLKDRVHLHKRQEALGEKVVSTSVGHPTVSSLEEEKDFVSRLKNLAARGFGCMYQNLLARIDLQVL